MNPVNTMICNWKENKDTMGNPIWQVKLEEGKLFDEPVQGNQNNTALIAALSSVTWANPFSLPITRCKSKNTYQISFYNPMKTIAVQDSLPWDGGNFCWAHKQESVEIWPGIYEKAYAALVMNAPSISCEEPLTMPDWLNKPMEFIPWGSDPLAILRHLIPTTRMYDSMVSTDAAKLVFDSIRNICTSCSLTETYEHMRTKNVRGYYATVGMTRPEMEYSFGTGGPLRANHAYSILGVMKDQSYLGDTASFSTDNNFVILRDPHAKKVKTFPRAPTSFLPMGDCIYSAVHVSCDGSTGVVAVPVSEFVYGFLKYGWVQW
jgi:hypothetical protein